MALLFLDRLGQTADTTGNTESIAILTGAMMPLRFIVTGDVLCPGGAFIVSFQNTNAGT